MALELKNVRLFESCSNRDLVVHRGKNINIGTYTEEDFTSSQVALECSLDVTDVQIDVEGDEIEKFFLQADADDFSRWEINHQLFDNELDVSSLSYMRKVSEILDEDWDDLEIYDDHVKR